MADGFGDFLLEQLAPLGHVTLRRMFGGTGVFCDGLMFAIVADEALFLKVDDTNRAGFEAEGLEPLSYEAKGRTVVLPYRRAPERLLDEPEELLAWARAALAASRRTSGKAKAKPGRKASHSRKPALRRAASDEG